MVASKDMERLHFLCSCAAILSCKRIRNSTDTQLTLTAEQEPSVISILCPMQDSLAGPSLRWKPQFKTINTPPDEFLKRFSFQESQGVCSLAKRIINFQAAMAAFHVLEIQNISECYNIIKELGQGSYGKVVLAQERSTGQNSTENLSDRTLLKTFLTEFSFSITLSEHPHIITTYPVFIRTIDHYVLSQELAAAGTLHDIIQSEVGIPEATVKRCARQISSALDYMHTRGLVPRDLKPDNVLLMDEDCYQVKLSDFGLTQPTGYYVSSMSHTIPYMSPELCNLKEGEYLLLSPTIDCWAFGVLLFVALTGYFPWFEAMENDSMYQVYSHWRQCPECIPPPACWKLLSREAICMFDNLFSQCPCSRQSVLSIFYYFNFLWKPNV
ncbi:serine/threonine-protein kinase SBK1-like [Dendrobates tinctorius]|uniref:serine/threonine-protein kinase SBK1-like n=1 Tax=Dendrobates tinctorius TaxID=92724 RepID=UPI003CC9DF12